MFLYKQRLDIWDHQDFVTRYKSKASLCEISLASGILSKETLVEYFQIKTERSFNKNVNKNEDQCQLSPDFSDCQDIDTWKKVAIF